MRRGTVARQMGVERVGGEAGAAVGRIFIFIFVCFLILVLFVLLLGIAQLL